jgi:hypothetical protein
VALLVALLVTIEGLSSHAFFLKDLAPQLRESNLVVPQELGDASALVFCNRRS